MAAPPSPAAAVDATAFLRDEDALAAGRALIQTHLAELVRLFEKERSRGFTSREPQDWHSDKKPRPYFAMIHDMVEIKFEYETKRVPTCSQAVDVFRRWAGQFYVVEYWSDIMGPELRFFEKPKETTG
jgi:hypothetical protein